MSTNRGNRSIQMPPKYSEGRLDNLTFAILLADMFALMAAVCGTFDRHESMDVGPVIAKTPESPIPPKVAMTACAGKT